MMVYQPTRLFARLLLRRVKVEWEGLEHIPTKGPAILAGNHPSAADPLMVMAKLNRSYCCVQRAENFVHPVGGWWLRHMRALPVSHDRDNTASFQAIEQWVREGQLYLTGPEGDVSVDGQVGPFTTSFVRLARKLDVPVIPLAIWGTEQCLLEPRRPKGIAGWRIRDCHARMAFLKPIWIQRETSENDSNAVVAERIRQIILRKLEGWNIHDPAR